MFLSSMYYNVVDPLHKHHYRIREQLRAQFLSYKTTLFPVGSETLQESIDY